MFFRNPTIIVLTLLVICAFVLLIGIIRHAKAKKIILCIIIVFILGFIIQNMPFSLKYLNRERIAEKGISLENDGSRFKLNREQQNELFKLLSDTTIQNTFHLKGKFKYISGAPDAYSLLLWGENGYSHIYLDYSNKENCFFSYEESPLRYQIDQDSADRLIEYLKVVVDEYHKTLPDV